ncbi:MAG: hypothetical protein JWO54_830 [Candidatus Saccharibacteria bacterium]|nr:hypothetical protein [Candidatus Saccharibacteria bacterium]
MIDKEATVILVRIVGIILSISSAVIMFIKPFEYVTNTSVVYTLLIAAALLVMIGQLITIRLNPASEYPTKEKRTEALYDVASIGVVMVLFVIFYVAPFVTKHFA